jgi:hypothetical protein
MTDKLLHDSTVITVSSILPVGIEQHNCVDTIRALYLGSSIDLAITLNEKIIFVFCHTN